MKLVGRKNGVIAICSTLIGGALIAFWKIGRSKGKSTREILSGWFIAVFRPTVLGNGALTPFFIGGTKLLYKI